MPAMPMADSSAPIVVGMRQTSSDDHDDAGDAVAVERQRVRDTGVVHLGVDRQRLQGRDGEHEDDRQRRQQDVQRDLVGRLLPVGALDERDHPVDEALARLLGDLDDDAVRQHGGAAGDRGAVAAGLADDGCGLAGDRRLIHRGNAFHDVAVAGDGLAGFDDDDVALLQQRRGDLFFAPGSAGRPADEAAGHGGGLGLAQRLGLRLAAAFGDGLGEVGEEHRQPQPDHDQPGEPGRIDDREDGAPRGADLDDEHDRVAPQRARVELAQRVGQRLPQHLRVEQAALNRAWTTLGFGCVR